MKILINRFKEKRIVKCRACRSVLLISLSDCSKHAYIDNTGYFACRCPLCETFIRVKNYKEM